MVYCPRCHAPNDAQATQCHYCGLVPAQIPYVPTKSSRTAFTLAVVWWAWCGLWVLFWLICGFLTFGVGWIFAILSFALAMLAFLWWRP